MDAIINALSSNQATFWFSLGFLLLVMDILAFGMASGVLLFSSVGALITGALLWFGIIPSTWVYSIASFAISSTVATFALWMPLKAMQSGAKLGNDRSSDLIGHQFRVDSNISRTEDGKHRYSGMDWRVRISEDSNEDSIASGSRVRVAGVDAGIFYVVHD